MSRDILTDTIKYLPAKIVPGIIGLLSVPFYTRILIPTEYGQYALMMSSVTMIGALCFSGINSSVIRFNLVYGVEILHGYLRPRLLKAIAIASILWMLVASFLRFPLQNTTFLLAGWIWIAAQGNYEYILSWLRSRGLAAQFSVAISWRSMAGLSLSGLLAWRGYLTGANLILSLAAAMLIAIPILRRSAIRTSQDNQVASTLRDTSQIARYGIPAAFISLVSMCLSNADRFLINKIVGVEAVAIYSASYDLAEKTVFFANSLFLLSSSVIGFRVFEKDGESAAVAFLESLTRFYLLIAPPFVMYLAACAGRIVSWLLPVGYQAGTVVIVLVATSGLLVGIMQRYSLLLSFHKRTDLIFWGSATALLANLAACAVLIPRYGITGAAAGTGIAYASWLIGVRFAASGYRTPRFPWRTVVRVMIALAAEWVTIRVMLQTATGEGVAILVFGLVTGLVVYGVSLLVTGEINPSELRGVWGQIINAAGRSRT